MDSNRKCLCNNKNHSLWQILWGPVFCPWGIFYICSRAAFPPITKVPRWPVCIPNQGNRSLSLVMVGEGHVERVGTTDGSMQATPADPRERRRKQLARASSEGPSSPVCLRHSCLEGRNIHDVGTIRSFLVLSTRVVPSTTWGLTCMISLVLHDRPMWQVLSTSHSTQEGSDRSSDLSKVTWNSNLTLLDARSKLWITMLNCLDGGCTMMPRRLFLCLWALSAGTMIPQGEGFQEEIRKNRGKQSLNPEGGGGDRRELSWGGQTHAHGSWVAWGWRAQVLKGGHLSSPLLCDLGQSSYPFYASVFPSVRWA